MEAREGLEPSHRGFADRSVASFATAPRDSERKCRRFAATWKESGPEAVSITRQRSAANTRTDNTHRRRGRGRPVRVGVIRDSGPKGTRRSSPASRRRCGPRTGNIAQIAADLNYTPPSFNAFDRVTDTDTPLQSYQDLGGSSLNLDWNVGRGR